MTLKVKAWKSGTPASGIGRGNYQITGAVAVGNQHSLAVKADGTVWTWGSNQSGQLGRAPYGGTQTAPGQVMISDVMAVSGGELHSLALKRDGTVWAWGQGFYGQLGNGSVVTQWDPVQVTGLTNVIALAASKLFSMALKSDGTVWMWGQLNGFNYGSTPAQIQGLSGVSQIATGNFHVLALKTDGEASGSVWAWGDNTYGFLGDGSYSDATLPIAVAGGTDFSAIAAGGKHSLGVRRDGTVWSWGDNRGAALADDVAWERTTPGLAAMQVGVPSQTFPIAGGSNTTFVLTRPSIRSAVRIAVAGGNSSGQLGIAGSTATAYWPVLNSMQGAIALGSSNSAAHSLAIHADGTVWSWGYNVSGQLGDGSTSNNSTPAAISNFSVADNAWLTGDTDSDGLTNLLEMELDTDPNNADTNEDGIPDGLAIDTGTDATNPDTDGDGLTNTREKDTGTDPFQVDSDGDGVADDTDCFPLESGRSQCPASEPGDTTPPTILLLEPTDAVLSDSTP